MTVSLHGLFALYVTFFLGIIWILWMMTWRRERQMHRKARPTAVCPFCDHVFRVESGRARRIRCPACDARLVTAHVLREPVKTSTRN